jgi:large subunit ribosomal protein L19e
MMKQKIIASKVLKCGVSRVWIDPARTSDVKDAITTEDIRRLIKDGIIKALPKQGLSSARRSKMMMQKRKGRRKGHGSRKGTSGARAPGKRQWIKRIRAIRALLKELRNQGAIERRTYRSLYTVSKSGFFRSKSHLMTHLERNNLLKKELAKEK